MAEDRPYRVYRGGGDAERRGDEPHLAPPDGTAGDDLPPWERSEPVDEPARRGPVVLPPSGAPPVPPPPPPGAPAPAAPAPRRRRRGGRTVLRVVGWLVLLGIVVLVAWLAIGYLAFRSAVADANARLPEDVRPVLTAQGGLLTSRPSTTLVLGADRTGRSDSMLLLRTDPSRGLVSTLALPRDLIVDIPGHGPDKLNAAYAAGGPALAVQAVERLTGLRVNHVVIVDFAGFVDLIDAVGGVEVDVPRPLRSEFDGYTYRFAAGPQTMSGKRALAYARIRKNQLDSADSDVSRGRRQQQVLAALKDDLASPRTLLRLRSVGSAAARPLSTDLTANQLLSLGWVELRATRRLQCNLGGDPSAINGADGLAPRTAANVETLSAFLGRSAPKPPPDPKVDPFGPGCRKG